MSGSGLQYWVISREGSTQLRNSGCCVGCELSVVKAGSKEACLEREDGNAACVGEGEVMEGVGLGEGCCGSLGAEESKGVS